ncbi:hypothetical protein [Luteimonas panaciterrae]|uniref:hypothetical protein n=1 Tax=Luteimonas panaciterrae TaxID=363885 RepID=UPI001CFA1D18|nr:hypothetical protein [Luteimonas panaciterrae]
MGRTNRTRYINAIDTLHAVRRDISKLQSETEAFLATVPAHDPEGRMPFLRSRIINLESAWRSIDDAIIYTEAALSPVVSQSVANT